MDANTRALIEHNWHIFPVPANSKKATLKFDSTTWSEYKTWDITTKLAKFAHHNGNWAFATGKQADGAVIFVVDVDLPEGAKSQARLEEQYGALPATLTATTPSGGKHYFFRGKPSIRNSTSTIAINIDIRGEGGYVVIAPSQCDGKTYVWDNNPLNTPIADSPDWLLELIQPTSSQKTASVPAQPTSDRAASADNMLIKQACEVIITACNGQRNDTLNKQAFTLFSQGIGWQDAQEPLTAAAQQVGLEGKEIAHTLRSAYDAAQASTQQDWPILIPLDTPDLPLLEAKHLPEGIRHYTQALADSTETPLELAAGMVLATCATAVARRLRVQVKPDYHEGCNLWWMVALAPGNRKSAVQSAAIQPLQSWEQEQAIMLAADIQRQTSERKTMEARAKALRMKAAKAKDTIQAQQAAEQAAALEANLPTIPIVPRLWTADATPEKLGQLLAEHNECMAWLSSEGGVFDLLQGRYNHNIPNLDLMLKAHSGDADRIDRKSSETVYLNHPRLTIGLSPQPQVLRSLADNRDFHGRGLLARFLYWLPASPLGYRSLQSKPMPDATRNDYNVMVHMMLNWVPAIDIHGNEQRHVLKLSAEAATIHRAFSHQCECSMRPGEILEHHTDWAGKAPGAVVRLAGVFHGIDYAQDRPWQHAIRADTMRAAVAVMECLIPHTLAAFQLMGANPVVASAQTVWRWIERHHQQRFTIREAFNALRSTFARTDKLRDALGVLEERGYINITEQPKDGVGRKPSPLVQVRPDIIKTW